MSDEKLRRHQARAKAETHPQAGASSYDGASRTKKMVTMAMMVAISVTLVYLIHFPIMPMVPFLEYDPADIPILIGTFAFGPLAGVALTAVTSLVQGLTVSAGSGFYGILMHIIATSALTTVAGTVYYTRKTKRTALIGLLLGMAVMALFLFAPRLLVALFLDPESTAARIARDGFPYYAIGIPFFILNVAIVGYCQSIERMKAAMSFVFLRGIGLLIPVFLLLPLLLGTEGIWLSMPLAEILTLAVIACWWLSAHSRWNK